MDHLDQVENNILIPDPIGSIPNNIGINSTTPIPSQVPSCLLPGRQPPVYREPVCSGPSGPLPLPPTFWFWPPISPTSNIIPHPPNKWLQPRQSWSPIAHPSNTLPPPPNTWLYPKQLLSENEVTDMIKAYTIHLKNFN